MSPTSSHAASQTRALWILAVLAALAGLKVAASLLIPVVLAVLASLALEPVVARLARVGVPRAAAAGLVVLALVGGLGGGVYAFKDRIVAGVQALPDAFRRAEAMVETQLAAAGFPEGPAPEALPEAMGGAAAAAQRAAQTVMTFAGHLTVIVFLIFFLLQSGPEACRRIVGMAGSEERRRVVATILTDVNAQVQRFLVVQVITSAIVTAVTWAVLAWMGTANALIWAVLAGIFNSIPYFGPVVVSGGLFVVGMVQGGSAEAVRLALAALVITSLEGWLLTPPLMGRVEKMNALSVFLGLLVWTWLWGAWGTLLAVPMLAVVKSVADRVDGLKPVGRLMAQ